MSQGFGRKKSPYDSFHHHARKKWSSSGVFLGLLIIGLFVFSVHYRFSSLLFDEKKIDIVQHKLGDIANYLSFYDPTSSRLLARLDSIIQYAQQHNDVLSKQSDQIESLWNDIVAHQASINTTTKNKYEKILQFIVNLKPYHNEIINFLGKEREQYYLIILQNTAEQRPNGGFFGSFAIVSLYQGKIKTFHLIDSYLPQKYIHNIGAELPQRAYPIYPDKKTGWIAANKFGFHDLDGKILIDLYNQTFNSPESSNLPVGLCKDLCHKKISGVVFLKTKMMNVILPGFQKKQREWQFFNASIDLIRGINLPNKKEKYFENLKSFLGQQQGQLIKRLLIQFEKLTSQPYLGIYLPSASSGLQQQLIDYHLTTTAPTTIQQQKVLYLRDTNISFNKIDDFVTRNIIIKNKLGDTILETSDSILPLYILAKGEYTMKISYTVAIPDTYKKYISGLEKQYGITMTDRERGILALEATDNYSDFIKRLWSTRSQLYYPNGIEVNVLGGDGFQFIPFTTPRGKGLQYKMETANNNTTSTITLGLKKP